MATVWDLRQADLSTFTIEEMRQLGDYLGHFEYRRGVRTALVYRSPLELPLLKLWHLVGNGFLEQDRRWFETLGGAMAWAACSDRPRTRSGGTVLRVVA
ncbi:hypothetical protein ACFOGJ_24345 [Marinibaculum pumilum]|uniref:Uncharacterized protein n=1 Tax=Marinibaculum pumilum TaxID=1766165 RepID=A0ABV7L823_9PROT